MPLDLFDGQSLRPPAPSSGRRVLFVVSLASHTLVIGGALFLSLTSPGLIPTPRVVLAFTEPSRIVQMIDIELPPRPRTTTTTPATPSPSAAPVLIDVPIDTAMLAPVVAPIGISQETGFEQLALRQPAGLNIVESGSMLGLGVSPPEKPAAPIVQPPMRLSSGIQTPVKLAHADPVYPSLAQSSRVQGVVILEAIIDVAGNVDSVRVLKSIPLLDDAAKAAVRTWRYSPARLNGEPVPVIMTITVSFRL